MSDLPDPEYLAKAREALANWQDPDIRFSGITPSPASEVVPRFNGREGSSAARPVDALIAREIKTRAEVMPHRRTRGLAGCTDYVPVRNGKQPASKGGAQRLVCANCRRAKSAHAEMP